MQNLTPEAFRDLIGRPGTVLLDVRMPEEVALAALPGAINIPLAELGQRVSELNASAPIAVLCHHGVRSEMAGRFLEHMKDPKKCGTSIEEQFLEALDN